MLKLVLGVMLFAFILLLHGINRTPDNYRSAEFPEEQMPAAMKTVDEVANLPAGAQLYFRDSNRPFAVVVAVDSAHEFADGTFAAAVQVEFKDGTQLWLQLKHLRNLLTNAGESR